MCPMCTQTFDNLFAHRTEMVSHTLHWFFLTGAYAPRKMNDVVVFRRASVCGSALIWCGITIWFLYVQWLCSLIVCVLDDVRHGCPVRAACCLLLRLPMSKDVYYFFVSFCSSSIGYIIVEVTTAHFAHSSWSSFCCCCFCIAFSETNQYKRD